MLGPDAAASESAASGLGLFDCGVDPRDFSAANERAVAYQASSLALGSTPGGSPTAAAVPPKSTCFASLLPKSATSAKSDLTFPLVLP